MSTILLHEILQNGQLDQNGRKFRTVALMSTCGLQQGDRPV
jgi:hypothetical protein